MKPTIEQQCAEAMYQIQKFIDHKALIEMAGMQNDFRNARIAHRERWDQIELELLGTKEERANRTIDMILSSAPFAA